MAIWEQLRLLGSCSRGLYFSNIEVSGNRLCGWSREEDYQMHNMGRRSFLGAAMAAFPLALMGQSIKTSTPVRATRVPAGEDRFGERHNLGASLTDFKVSTQDSSGALFTMEHTNRKKGGPPRHLHHNEDEWFYAIEGEYLIEVGSERFQLKSGDSILAPREVPHVFAFVGETHGKLLIAFAPANRMEAFFREYMKRQDSAYSNADKANDKELYRAYGMDLLGPPLSVG
jgi:mannose-6-phosphate isomerase-like protein (cupin superfamily)